MELLNASLFENFIGYEDSLKLFPILMEETHWEQKQIKLYGKEIPIPRLTAWYGDKTYSYSGTQNNPSQWTETLLTLKEQVENKSGHKFNSALLNLYRHGQDSVTWHSDDEPELGESPVIASLSFGATRKFQLRHKKDKALKREFILTDGSLLVMREGTQENWEHQIPKTSKLVGNRINITFRKII